MKETFEYKGYWFLPSNPEQKVAGILTYIPYERITLELIGTFNSEIDALSAFFDKQKEHTIQGTTSDSKEVTLINCHPAGSLNLSCPFPIVRYSCQYIILGKHIKDLDETCAYQASVQIPELTHWCYPGALHNTIAFEEGTNDKTYSISFSEKEIRETIINATNIEDHTLISLRKSVSFDGTEHFLHPEFEQYTYIEIKKNKDSSIKEFLSDIFMYEQFLSLATLQSVECSKIIINDLNIFQEIRNGKKIHRSIEVIYIQDTTKKRNRVKSNDFLFNYSSISSQYSTIIQKWYTDSKNIAPIRSHLIESIKDKKSFGSIDFLIVIYALEGFCTRFRKEESLTTMLSKIINEFSIINKLKEDLIIIREVTDSRNYYSHFMNKSKKPKTLEGYELYLLTKKLRKILICCVLHFVGFDHSQINTILNKSNNKYLD